MTDQTVDSRDGRFQEADASRDAQDMSPTENYETMIDHAEDLRTIGEIISRRRCYSILLKTLTSAPPVVCAFSSLIMVIALVANAADLSAAFLLAVLFSFVLSLVTLGVRVEFWGDEGGYVPRSRSYEWIGKSIRKTIDRACKHVGGFKTSFLSWAMSTGHIVDAMRSTSLVDSAYKGSGVCSVFLPVLCGEPNANAADVYASLVKKALRGSVLQSDGGLPSWAVDGVWSKIIKHLDDGCWSDSAPEWASGIADGANKWRLVQAMEIIASMPHGKPDGETVKMARDALGKTLRLEDLDVASREWAKAEKERKSSERRKAEELARQRDIAVARDAIAKFTASRPSEAALEDEIRRLRAQLDEAEAMQAAARDPSNVKEAVRR